MPRLKKITRREGAVRLSVDDGPAATEFLEDDYDEDLEDDEPLALADRARVGNEVRKLGVPARVPTSEPPVITLT